MDCSPPPALPPAQPSPLSLPPLPCLLLLLLPPLPLPSRLVEARRSSCTRLLAWLGPSSVGQRERSEVK